MTDSVNNGRRAEVSFGGYSGKAGVVERAGRIEVAFPGEARRYRNITAGTIDGEAYAVLKASDDPFVKGMVVLTVEPA